jgi:hypothetical protein
MLLDPINFKPYICFVFQNLSIYHTYIYSIGPTPKSVEYRVFRRFTKLPELPRQFSPDMSGLWPGHMRLAGHVRFLERTCPGLRFPRYIRGPLPLGTLASLITSSSNLLRRPSSLKPILVLLHRVPSVPRGFDFPTLCDLQILVEFLYPIMVSSRFLRSSLIYPNA